MKTKLISKIRNTTKIEGVRMGGFNLEIQIALYLSLTLSVVLRGLDEPDIPITT